MEKTCGRNKVEFSSIAEFKEYFFPTSTSRSIMEELNDKPEIQGMRLAEQILKRLEIVDKDKPNP